MNLGRSGGDSEVDRLEGFAAGADEYVVKPFSVRELTARVRVLAAAVDARRRARRIDAAADARVLRWRELILDVPGHRVLAAGSELELRPLEYMLLFALMECPDRLWSREDLIARLWDAETVMSPRTIDVHVRRLREHLGPYAEAIETVHGSGYRLRRPQRFPLSGLPHTFHRLSFMASPERHAGGQRGPRLRLGSYRGKTGGWQRAQIRAKGGAP